MNKTKHFLLLSLIPIATFLAGLWMGDITIFPSAETNITKPDASSTAVNLIDSTVADQLSYTFEKAAERISPSVVPIFAEEVVTMENPYGEDPFRDFFGDDFFKRFFGTAPRQGQDQKQTVHSLGSGVIISGDGYILTNNHVVQDARKITVVLEDEKKYPAKVIGTDPQSDVAVIKIDAANLPTALLGDSDNLRVGQWVIAVGNPYQLMHTVTAGIISAKGRSNIGLAEYEDFIQTDASINPGNSGGALCDLQGRVIGINTAISSPTGSSVGIGFAIPIKMAQGIMKQLIDNGKVSRGYLGIVPQDIDDNLAKAMKLKNSEGALVGDVEAGSPADKAGIKRGDVITKFDGADIKNSTQLRNLAARTKPGSTIKVTVIRNGNPKELSLTLAERPQKMAANQPSSTVPTNQLENTLGLELQNLTPDIANQLGYSNEKGVVVTSVTSGSAAEDAGLQSGDLIKEVNRKEVSTVTEFIQELSKVKKGDSVALLVQRGPNTFYVGIEVPLS